MRSVEFQRSRMLAEAAQCFRKVGTREQHELRVVVMRELGERRLGELAGGRVVAHGDERRREVRHHRRMLRRALAAPQRFQRLVEIADRVVHAIGEEMRGTDRIQQPEPVLRREYLLRHRVEREQAVARGDWRALDDREACGADFGQQRAAALAGLREAVRRGRDPPLGFQRMGGEEQMVERDGQLAPRARAGIDVRGLGQKRLCLCERGLGIAKMEVPQRRTRSSGVRVGRAIGHCGLCRAHRGSISDSRPQAA